MILISSLVCFIPESAYCLGVKTQNFLLLSVSDTTISPALILFFKLSIPLNSLCVKLEHSLIRPWCSFFHASLFFSSFGLVSFSFFFLLDGVIFFFSSILFFNKFFIVLSVSFPHTSLNTASIACFLTSCFASLSAFWALGRWTNLLNL